MRLRALDFLRGVTVVGMILVNNPGSEFSTLRALQHAGWYGIRFADVIAPGFLWTMGFAMAISLARRGADSRHRSATLHVLRRSAMLFFIGVGLHLFGPLFPDLDWAAIKDTDLMGILQRIALAYALSGILLLYVPRPASIAVGLLALYALLMYVGVEGGDVASAFAQGSNLANHIDEYLLGQYASEAHSLLTILPTGASVLLGAATARELTSTGTVRLSARAVLLCGLLPMGLGILSSMVIPITRYLWSPSYALVTAGLPALAFVALHSAMSRTALEGAPHDAISAVGANPLLLFILSEAGRVMLESVGSVGPDGSWRSVWQAAHDALVKHMPDSLASLAMSVTYLSPFLGLATILARRRIYVKI